MAFNFRNRPFLRTHLWRLTQFLPLIFVSVIPVAIWGYYKKKFAIESADNVDFSPLFNPATYGQTFSATKYELIDKGYLNLVFLSNFWFAYVLLLIMALVYLVFCRVRARIWGYFLSEFFFPTACGLAIIALMTLTFWVLPDKDLPSYIATGADRLALHSYYMIGVCLLGCCTTLLYKPFNAKSQISRPIRASQTGKSSKLTPTSTKPLSTVSKPAATIKSQKSKKK